jgi:hypothetical protein
MGLGGGGPSTFIGQLGQIDADRRRLGVGCGRRVETRHRLGPEIHAGVGRGDDDGLERAQIGVARRIGQGTFGGMAGFSVARSGKVRR